jgi:integrase
MPHAPWPFYKAVRNCWYVEIHRKQINLGRHPTDLPLPTKVQGKWQPPADILQAFYRHMADVPDTSEKPLPKAQDLLELFDEFLEWTKKHRAAGSFRWYQERLQWFSDTLKEPLTVKDLKPFHVTKWVDAHPEWSESHQRGCMVAVQRALYWAEEIGYIDISPIRKLKKPPAGRREQIITEEEYEELLANTRSQELRDLLVMSWHTGARPQETMAIEPRHCELEHHRIVFPKKEAKGKKRFRIIYLNAVAEEIIERLLRDNPEGVLFRNSRGRAWNPASVLTRLRILRRRIGRKRATPPDPEEVQRIANQLPQTRVVEGRVVPRSRARLLNAARRRLIDVQVKKNTPRYCLYSFRHSFAQRLLVAGVDSLTVSALLGHVDGSMLAKVYSHLHQNADYLLKTVNCSTDGNQSGA